MYRIYSSQRIHTCTHIFILLSVFSCYANFHLSASRKLYVVINMCEHVNRSCSVVSEARTQPGCIRRQLRRQQTTTAANNSDSNICACQHKHSQQYPPLSLSLCVPPTELIHKIRACSCTFVHSTNSSATTICKCVQTPYADKINTRMYARNIRRRKAFKC